MNSSNFSFRSLPSHVYFGKGKSDELKNILSGYSRIFAIGADRVNDKIEKLGNNVYHFQEVVQHVPRLLVEKALEACREFNPDVLVAIGGGSAIGLAKAIALELPLPIAAVPTTFSGSEMTNIYGISTEASKTTGRDDRVLPRYVIYDPDLTATMPVGLAATSAMNANAHLMEAMYAHDTNPVTYQNAIFGMNKLTNGMQILAKEKILTESANELILLGAFLAGKGLMEVSMSLHHKAAHVLGGSFGMEHSKVHTVLQSYVLAYQWDSLSKLVKEDMKKALMHPYPPVALQDIAKAMGAPFTLREIGFKEEDIDKAADIMLEKPYANPKPITREGIVNMLSNAYYGKVTEQ